MSENQTVIILEEVCGVSGIRVALAWELRRLVLNGRLAGRDVGKGVVRHGSQKELYRHCGLDAAAIADSTKEVLSK